MSAPADRYVLAFDGVDDRVQIAPRSLAQFTVGAWIWAPTIGESNEGEFIHFGDQGAAIYLETDGTVSGYFHNSDWTVFDAAGTVQLQAETWNHVAIRYNQTVLEIIVNGTVDASESVTATPGTSIGSQGSIGSAYYSGGQNFVELRAADVFAYSRAVSNGEIDDIMAGSPPSSDLVRFYALDEGTDTAAANTGSDISANGTIIGATWFFVEADEEADFTPIAPNAVLATENLEDTLSNSPPTRLADIQDSPDDPDADWWTAVDVTAGTMARLGFPSPPAALVGQQQFRLWLRKTAGTPNPTVDIELWEDGAHVETLVQGASITSTTGQLVTANWSPALLSGDGSDAEVRIVATEALV